MKTGAIKIPDFLIFLSKIYQHSKGERCYLLLDNLRLHHSQLVWERANQFNIEIIFNSPYSSEYNMVERLWLFAKRNFSKKMITVTDFKDQAKIEKLVAESILEVSPDFV